MPCRQTFAPLTCEKPATSEVAPLKESRRLVDRSGCTAPRERVTEPGGRALLETPALRGRAGEAHSGCESTPLADRGQQARQIVVCNGVDGVPAGVHRASAGL